MLIPNPNNVTGLSRVQRSQQGFTLIELLMTVSVMAVIVALATPSMSKRLADQRVKETAKMVEMAFKEAKAQSVILGKNVTVTYTEASDGKVATVDLSITTANSAVTKRVASYQLNESTKIKMALLSSGSSSDDPAIVVFQPSKRVSGSGVRYTICDLSSSQETPVEVIVDVVANVSAKTVTDGGDCS